MKPANSNHTTSATASRLKWRVAAQNKDNIFRTIFLYRIIKLCNVFGSVLLYVNLYNIYNIHRAQSPKLSVDWAYEVENTQAKLCQPTMKAVDVFENCRTFWLLFSSNSDIQESKKSKLKRPNKCSADCAFRWTNLAYLTTDGYRLTRDLDAMHEIRVYLVYINGHYMLYIYNIIYNIS